ncbi:hypothetical protein F5Y14DRAFT_204256 [Nemania sp. NC0429]|nr:hypothetical protein F5Y14DRAFT_204256 [Nemania sp. NC0429]
MQICMQICSVTALCFPISNSAQAMHLSTKTKHPLRGQTRCHTNCTEICRLPQTWHLHLVLPPTFDPTFVILFYFALFASKALINKFPTRMYIPTALLAYLYARLLEKALTKGGNALLPVI